MRTWLWIPSTQRKCPAWRDVALTPELQGRGVEGTEMLCVCALASQCSQNRTPALGRQPISKNKMARNRRHQYQSQVLTHACPGKCTPQCVQWCTHVCTSPAKERAKIKLKIRKFSSSLTFTVPLLLWAPDYVQPVSPWGMGNPSD